MPRRPRCSPLPLTLAALAALVLAGAYLARVRCQKRRPTPRVALPEAQTTTATDVPPSETVPMAFDPAPNAEEATRLPEILIDPAVVIEKGAQKLSVLSEGVAVVRYPIGLPGNPEGAKERSGDGRTPEGSYYVCRKSDSTQSGRSMTISYPGYDDADRGLTRKLIGPREHRAIVAELRRMGCPPSRTALGGGVRLRSTGRGEHAAADGDVVLADSHLAELFDAIPLGTPIDIVP